MIKNIFKKNYILDALFIFILSFIPLLWFKGNSILIGNDNVFPLDPKTFFIGRLFTWIPFNFGQSQSLIMGTIPVHLVDFLPYLLGFSVQTTQKMVYVFWFFLMAISVYILASEINQKSRIFKLTAVIFYAVNFYILQGWWIGERTKFSAYAALPLLLTIFFRVYKNKTSVFKASVLNTLVLFLLNGGGLFGVPLFGGVFIGVGTFILFFISLSIRRKDYKAALNLTKVVILTLLGFLIINSYYILPAISHLSSQFSRDVTQLGGLSGLVDWASEISANASFINLLRLQGISEWYDNIFHPYARYFLTNPILITISFVWPLLILLSLFISKKQKDKEETVIYFFLVFLLGVFFAGGTHPPFGFVYVFLIQHIPGFAIFRTPYFKFAPAIFLPASFLMAFLIDAFNFRIKSIIFILFAFLVFLYHFPYFTGNFFSWRPEVSTRNNIPSYVYDFGKWAQTTNIDDRILLLPGTATDWQFDAYDWGYLSLQALPTVVTNKNIIVNDNKLNVEEGQLIFDLYAAISRKDVDSAKKMTDLLRIKYILVREDVNYKGDWLQIQDPYVYENTLQSVFNFPLIKDFGRWKVYKVTFDSLPKIFTVNSLESLDAPVYAVSDYLSLNRQQLFYMANSAAVKNSGLSKITASTNIVLPCMTCLNTNAKVIEFPDPKVLPDSPLYSLVILKEKLAKKSPDPKVRIYDDLGVTLKRVGEIRNLILNNRVWGTEVLERYITVLKLLRADFALISDLRDQTQIAQDIHFYMDEEVQESRSLFSYTIHAKDNIEDAVTLVFNTIISISDEINPYLFAINTPSQKFYYVKPAMPGEYTLLLRNSGLDSFGSKFDIKTAWDRQEVATTNVSLAGRWIDLGKRFVSSDPHVLNLTLPSIPNVAGDLNPDPFRIDVTGNIPCYSSEIKNFDNKKTYDISFAIPKDLDNRLYMYFIKEDTKGTRIGSFTKFGSSHPNIYESLMSSNQNIKKISLGICAQNIDKNTLENKLQIKISEVFYPELFLVSAKKDDAKISSVSYTTVDPTKYILHVKTTKPAVLVFTDRFDNGWRINSSSFHFKVLGYANGFLIDKPGSYTFTLEYEPQKRFYQGLAVTAGVLIFCILYILKPRKKHE